MRDFLGPQDDHRNTVNGREQSWPKTDATPSFKIWSKSSILILADSQRWEFACATFSLSLVLLAQF